MNLSRAILYYACAVLWLLRTCNRPNVFDGILTAVLLIGGVVHTVKYLRQKREEKERKHG